MFNISFPINEFKYFFFLLNISKCLFNSSSLGMVTNRSRSALALSCSFLIDLKICDIFFNCLSSSRFVSRRGRSFGVKSAACLNPGPMPPPVVGFAEPAASPIKSTQISIWFFDDTTGHRSTISTYFFDFLKFLFPQWVIDKIVIIVFYTLFF